MNGNFSNSNFTFFKEIPYNSTFTFEVKIIKMSIRNMLIGVVDFDTYSKEKSVLKNCYLSYKADGFKMKN